MLNATATISFNMEFVRLLYKSHIFVAGIALILLGMGNYSAAVSKVNLYQTSMKNLSSIRQTASVFLPSGERSHFPSEAQERWEIARAKRDFYQVVLSAGRLMMGVGFLCTAISLMRLHRQRTLTSTNLFLELPSMLKEKERQSSPP
jgi:hypothetical protein